MNNIPRIFYYSGPVQSGKTTRLLQWVKHRKRIYGVLNPVVSGKKQLLLWPENRSFDLEADYGQQIEIGRYQFSEKVFAEARVYLEKIADRSMEWCIIDEVGMLELNGRGYEPILGKIINGKRMTGCKNILLVVRERLIEKVFHHYRISPDEFILDD